MRHSRRLSWVGTVVLAVMAAGCGGGSEAEHEDEGRDLTGPSAAVATPAPTPVPEASPAPTPTPAAPPTPAGGGAASVAWEQDIRPILENDCVRCHGYLSSYAGTMSVVAPGNPNSTLVTMTRSGGAMYSHLSGDRAAKSALIRAWVVDNGAAQSR